MSARDTFTESFLADARTAFRVLRETGTLTASATLSFVVRVPGEELLASVKHPDPLRPGTEPEVQLTSVEDGPGALRPWGDGLRYAAVFAAHPWLGAISHVHTPHLAAWGQTQRPFPLRYVPVQRDTLAEELPVYLDRREGEDEFIVRVLKDDPEVPAILEANGGATVWSRGGLLDLARTILLLEEGAQAQILAASVGGARLYGPGVLAQQWGAMGRADSPRARARIAALDEAAAGS